MKGDINTVAGVLIIITVSLILGFLFLRQGDIVTDAVEYAPEGIGEIRTLQNTLREPDPTPLSSTSSKGH